MRYGTRTVLGRGWTPIGKRPSGKMRIGYKYEYLYLALCPKSGDVFALFLPTMQTECYNIFLSEFADYLFHRGIIEYGKPNIRLIADNAGTHHAEEIVIPHCISSEHLPAYSPELNPCERFFEEVRRKLKNEVCATVEEVEIIIIQVLKYYWDNPDATVKLIYWDWMKNSTTS